MRAGGFRNCRIYGLKGKIMNLSNSYNSSGCRYRSNEEIDLLIAAQEHWIDNLVQDGWNAYYVSVLFHQLPGSQKSHLEQMKREINRLYNRLATRSVKDPRSPTLKRYLPVGVFVPDLPVEKYKGKEKISLADASINNGLHMNGIIVANRWGRIRTGLIKHFKEKRNCYETGIVRSVGLTRIKDDLGHVVDYAFKSVKRRRFSMDDVVLLDWGGSSKANGAEENARKELGLGRSEWLKFTQPG
jgi:hypothetical protein